MTTLEKIRKYASEHGYVFKDFRKDGIVSDLQMEPSRYELLYAKNLHTYKGFDTQQDIEDFLKEQKNKDMQ